MGVEYNSHPHQLLILSGVLECFALPSAPLHARVIRDEQAKLQRRTEDLQRQVAFVYKLWPTHAFPMHAPRCTTLTVTINCAAMFASVDYASLFQFAD